MSLLGIELASFLNNVDEYVGGYFRLKKQNHLVFSVIFNKHLMLNV